MTKRRTQQRRTLPFWKRWFFRAGFALTAFLALLFTGLTVALPFMYDTGDQSRGVLLYAMGMSAVLALVCADSARRIRRKMQPK